MSVKTWPGLYDLAATGHVNFGETTVISAKRELNEELGLDLSDDDLLLFFVYRQHNLVSPNGFIENEFQWVYGAQIDPSVDLNFKDGEVASVEWVAVDEFKQLMGSSRFAPTEKPYAANLLAAVLYHSNENH